MADIDLSQLSVSELQELINRASDAKFQAENDAKNEAETRKVRIKEAAGRLEALLGPADAKPGVTSIREVLAYGEDTIKANPGVALVLILQGMEQLTSTTLDLARTISEA